MKKNTTYVKLEGIAVALFVERNYFIYFSMLEKLVPVACDIASFFPRFAATLPSGSEDEGPSSRRHNSQSLRQPAKSGKALITVLNQAYPYMCIRSDS